MTYCCILCAGHYDEDKHPGNDYGSIFFPEGILVCRKCSLERDPWLKTLALFETHASVHEKEALSHLVWSKEFFEGRIIEDGHHEPRLEYGENAPEIVEDNKKFYEALNKYNQMEIDFDGREKIETLAEVLYIVSWRNSGRSVGERVSWYSESNKKMIQAKVIEKEGKTYTLEALPEENYKVKDKNGILQNGARKKLSEKSIKPPKISGKDLFKKQKVCHGCRKLHLKGVIMRGLDHEEHWFCTKCDIMTFGSLPSHEVYHYHEHYGKPMSEIPEHHRKKFREHNLSVMERECWPCTDNTPWPNPLPQKKDVQKFGMDQHEKDILWIQDETRLTKCMSCSMKLSRGWADIRVDENDWNCEYCWMSFYLREDSPKRKGFIAGREKCVILATDSDGNVTPGTLLDENYWKLSGVPILNFIYNSRHEDTVKEESQKSKENTNHLLKSSGRKKKKKSKGVKMNLGEFHNFA